VVAKLGATAILATDINPRAVQVTAGNAAINDLSIASSPFSKPADYEVDTFIVS